MPLYCRRKFGSQTPTIWTDEAAEMGRGREEKEPEEKSEKRKKGRRQEIKVRKKVQKSQSTVFLQCFVAQEGRKVGMKWCRKHISKSKS